MKNAIQIVCVVMLMAVVLPAMGDPNYVVVDLHPGGAFSSSTASGISGGVIVGYGEEFLPNSGKAQKALLWPGTGGSVPASLTPAGYSESSAYGIDGVQQVGRGQTGPYEDGQALLWSGTAGSVVNLTPSGFDFCTAQAVQGAQQVGTGTNSHDGKSHALLWSGTAASAVDLHPVGYDRSSGYDTSDGMQVGTAWTLSNGKDHAILWSGTPASAVDLHPTGFTRSRAYGISGVQQVGYGETPDPGGTGHALLWYGTPESVVDLHPEGYSSSKAEAVSNGRQAGRGNISFPSGSVSHALVWSGSAQSVLDLHDFLDARYTPSATNSSVYGIDALGNVVGTTHMGETHATMWWLAGPLNLPYLTVGMTGQLGPIITLDSAKTLTQTQRLVIESASVVTLDGFSGNVAEMLHIQSGGRLGGHGAIRGPVRGDALSAVSASGGDLTMGDVDSFQGFQTDGVLSVGPNTVTLHARSFANLGVLTELDGGTLVAANGVGLGTGDNLAGWGAVDAKVSAAFASTIEAGGNLALGDANAYDGFSSDGSLITGANTVTIKDRNQAVVGSLTQLGTAAADGTLIADNGLLVEFGKNVVGRGTLDTPNDPFTPLTNNGAIVGDFPGAVVLTGYVKGVGTLDNVTVTGTLSPGLSTTRLYVGNLAIDAAGELLMELGGPAAGSGHDQIHSSGLLTLAGALSVELIGQFDPQQGAEFDLFDGLMSGQFRQLDLPDLPGDLNWDTTSLYTKGTITVIPEPATVGMLLVGGVALVRRRKRGACK